jgi:predicted lipoprotein with Yx(FWY)xxD motif
MEGLTVKRLVVFIIIGAVVVALAIFAAVGGFSGKKASGTTTTVTTKQVSGVGTVLTTSSGMPLYTTLQESNGKVLCTGSCTTVWVPLTISKGSPTGTTTAGTLGVTTRANGVRQVTLNGKPLYTFFRDTSGVVNGNNVHDSFNGQHFTWHVVLIGGTSSPPSSGGASGGGYGGY